MPGPIGRKIKAFQQAEPGMTRWQALQKVQKDTPGRCKGCNKKYANMSAGEFNRHKEFLDQGSDMCPDRTD